MGNYQKGAIGEKDIDDEKEVVKSDEKKDENEKKKKEEKMKKMRDEIASMFDIDGNSDSSVEYESEEEEEGEDDEDESKKSTKKFKNVVKVVIVGMGNRGLNYSYYGKEFPQYCKIVGICEPREHILEKYGEVFKLEKKFLYKDWREVIELEEKIADAVFICTQDRDHYEPCVAFAERKYHILLEKPMAQTLEECEKIVEAVKKNDVYFAVCHVMRYTQASQVVKKLLREERIGKILHIQHIEPVGFFHFAHSYIRGNWRNEKESNFILMTKCCHDVDLICHFMGENNKVTKVSSFGSLSHFKRENQPKEIEELQEVRCFDCPVEKGCPYSAKKIYYDNFFAPQLIVDDGTFPTLEKVRIGLQTSPYGRCVYRCDNDVCDNQNVNFEFESGATASLSMISTSKELCIRTIRIFGTQGEITLHGGKVTMYEFISTRTYSPKTHKYIDTSLKGHGYGDYYLVRNFIKAVRKKDKKFLLSNEDETLWSHKLVFMAEKSRKEASVLTLDENYNQKS